MIMLGYVALIESKEELDEVVETKRPATLGFYFSNRDYSKLKFPCGLEYVPSFEPRCQGSWRVMEEEEVLNCIENEEYYLDMQKRELKKFLKKLDSK